jgi:hypothetical protein
MSELRGLEVQAARVLRVHQIPHPCASSRGPSSSHISAGNSQHGGDLPDGRQVVALRTSPRRAIASIGPAGAIATFGGAH